MNRWQDILKEQADIFIGCDWQECTNDKRKEWRLPHQYKYFFGGETALRVGIIISENVLKEEDFLLAGLILAHRLSNGAKTVIYFIAPDFSPFFLHALNKIGGVLSARAVYWRKKLTPSLYLVPEQQRSSRSQYTLGENRPDLRKWQQELNPVAQHQCDNVIKYFQELSPQVRMEIKPQSISFLWGNLEIAEIRRKGKKIDIKSKAKWEKNSKQRKGWETQGWVDSSGLLNKEYCLTIENILSHLETKKKEGALKDKAHLSLLLQQADGVVSTLWGSIWDWPWLPKDRSESWINDLENWYYFEGNGHLSVVCPVLEKPLITASQSLILLCILETSNLLYSADNILWDYKINWLTQSSLEGELRLWLSWLADPEQFKIWTLPDNWRTNGIYELKSK